MNPENNKNPKYRLKFWFLNFVILLLLGGIFFFSRSFTQDMLPDFLKPKGRPLRVEVVNKAPEPSPPKQKSPVILETETPGDESVIPAEDFIKKEPAAEKSGEALKDQQPQVPAKKNRKNGSFTPRPKRIRNSRIFFGRVNEDGAIHLKSVIHQVAFDLNPLTETVKNLLQGPYESEINRNFTSFIPGKTALISATIKGSTAVLNFNEAFRFNPLGREGSLFQLEQIVYTVTEFPQIKSVQFLVEGQKIDYLMEGVYSGAPFTRSSFESGRFRSED